MSTVDYAHKETLLKLEGVSSRKGDNLILRDVNLEIKNLTRPGLTQGQVVGLLGPSGMGKTTLFRILAGLDEPDEGSVLVGQKQVPVQRGMVGVVAQNYPLFAHRTVKGNLLVAGKQSDLPAAQVEEKATQLLSRFGLSDQTNKYPAQLSGGQRQRVAIAQQFMCSEGFLLMDEPFSGLDLLAQERVLGFIAEMAAANELNTFILVTHDISAALQVCDTIWLMGRDRDAKGEPIPGARIQASYDLIERGLCYQPNITTMPEYLQVRNEIRERFHYL
ncbi:MAG TPA: ATP-binding cassette domain-containing protein [Abditibacteriaceae bacterium]|jgi:polar amino acid transport system ATP-binding protein/sulfate transport system ATP-binding protein